MKIKITIFFNFKKIFNYLYFLPNTLLIFLNSDSFYLYFYYQSKWEQPSNYLEYYRRILEQLYWFKINDINTIKYNKYQYLLY